MANERPDNWHPPAQELGGENILTLFAIMFLNGIVGMMYAKDRDSDPPIASEMDELDQKEKAMFARLKHSGHSDREGNGSLYDDFKRMRTNAYIEIGTAMGIENPKEARVAGHKAIKSQFNPEMPTSEALELAMRIVASWDWEQEAK